MTRDALLEALLFTSGDSLGLDAIADILSCSPSDVIAIAEELSQRLQGRGVALLINSDGLQLRTVPEASEIIKRFHESELSADLGRASLEVLSVILYKGSATRRDIDYIRGVNSSASLRTLLLRGLIQKSDAGSGRQIVYSATNDALAHLGVTSRESLPQYEEYAQALSQQFERTEGDSTTV